MKNQKDRSQSTSLYSHYKGMADDAASLQILELIEQSQDITQRKIKNKTGLAAGLVHSYMRQVINKGWVKAKQVSAKRWLYYLTPEGFLEKSRLTVQYLSWTLHSYKSAQSMILKTLITCRENGCHKLVVAGDDHLAEILILNIKADNEFLLVGVIVDNPSDSELSDENLFSFDDIHNVECDRILVSDVKFIKYCQKNGHNAALHEKLIHLSI